MNCGYDDEDTYSKLSEEGVARINNASKQRSLKPKDLVFSKETPFFVHKRCRSKCTNPKNVKVTQKRKISSEERAALNRRSTDP